MIISIIMLIAALVLGGKIVYDMGNSKHPGLPGPQLQHDMALNRRFNSPNVPAEFAAGGMLLVVNDPAEEDGLAARAVVPQNDWHEAHITGAQRLRRIGPFVLPLLLLTAGVLSFISPEENESTEDFWDDDCSF